MRTRRFVTPILAVVVTVGSLSSCATVTGAFVGAVAYPLSNVHNTYATPWWQHVLELPFVVGLGPVVCAFAGFEADRGYLLNGDYGMDRCPPFEIALDPLRVIVDDANAGMSGDEPGGILGPEYADMEFGRAAPANSGEALLDGDNPPPADPLVDDGAEPPTENDGDPLVPPEPREDSQSTPDPDDNP